MLALCEGKITMSVIETIFSLFDRYGNDLYGEDATQISHALQCAALARAHDCPDTLVAAALLHDVGQFVENAGLMAKRCGIDARHEDLGSQLLAEAFPASITEPIRLHVAAKRYLCAADLAYAQRLSAASLLSLQLQGGPMSGEECAVFEREPYFADAVTLRRFDDAGKAADLEDVDLSFYRPMLEALLIPSNRQSATEPAAA